MCVLIILPILIFIHFVKIGSFSFQFWSEFILKIGPEINQKFMTVMLINGLKAFFDDASDIFRTYVGLSRTSVPNIIIEVVHSFWESKIIFVCCHLFSIIIEFLRNVIISKSSCTKQSLETGIEIAIKWKILKAYNSISSAFFNFLLLLIVCLGSAKLSCILILI